MEQGLLSCEMRNVAAVPLFVLTFGLLTLSILKLRGIPANRSYYCQLLHAVVRKCPITSPLLEQQNILRYFRARMGMSHRLCAAMDIFIRHLQGFENICRLALHSALNILSSMVAASSATLTSSKDKRDITYWSLGG